MKTVTPKTENEKNTKQIFKLPSKFQKRNNHTQLKTPTQLSKVEMEIQIALDMLNFSDHTKHIPNIKNKIPFVSWVDNLPQKAKEIIEKYTNNELVIEGGCYQNSSHLSLLNPDIRIVQGYYGRKMSKNEKVEVTLMITRNKMKKNEFGMFELWSPFGRTFVLLEKGIMIDPHSWNCIDGIHFDITRNFDSKLKSNWVYYFPHRILNTSTIPDVLRENLTNKLKMTKLNGILKFKRQVLNLAS